MTKFIRWISNYWYHYKFRTILCLFFAVIAAFTVYELATRETYDLKVYLYMSEFVSGDVEKALEKTVEDYYIENGEEKNVQVINLSYDPYAADGDSRMSYAAALAGELRMKEHYLYITDEYRFEELDTNETFDNVFMQKDTFNNYDNKAYLINGGNFEKKFIENLKENNVAVDKLPNLYISLLTPPDENSKNHENFETAEKLADLIIKKDK